MKIIKLFTIAILFLSISACKKESSEAINDCIEILSVSPTTNLIDGQLTEFTIIGIFNLSTHSSARIDIGFNNNENPTQIIICPESFINIVKGKKEFNIKVQAIVKDWKSTNAFSVWISMRTSDSSKFLTGDNFEIIPKSN